MLFSSLPLVAHGEGDIENSRKQEDSTSCVYILKHFFSISFRTFAVYMFSSLSNVSVDLVETWGDGRISREERSWLNFTPGFTRVPSVLVIIGCAVADLCLTDDMPDLVCHIHMQQQHCYAILHFTCHKKMCRIYDAACQGDTNSINSYSKNVHTDFAYEVSLTL